MLAVVAASSRVLSNLPRVSCAEIEPANALRNSSSTDCFGSSWPLGMRFQTRRCAALSIGAGADLLTLKYIDLHVAFRICVGADLLTLHFRSTCGLPHLTRHADNHASQAADAYTRKSWDMTRNSAEVHGAHQCQWHCGFPDHAISLVPMPCESKGGTVGRLSCGYPLY